MDYRDEYDDLSYEEQFDDRYDLVEILYNKVIAESDLAYRLELSFDIFKPNRMWFPKSQIQRMEDNKIYISQWLAIEKGLV